MDSFECTLPEWFEFKCLKEKDPETNCEECIYHEETHEQEQ